MADTNYVLEAYNNYVIITSHFYLGKQASINASGVVDNREQKMYVN